MTKKALINVIPLLLLFHCAQVFGVSFPDNLSRPIFMLTKLALSTKLPVLKLMKWLVYYCVKSVFLFM